MNALTLINADNISVSLVPDAITQRNAALELAGEITTVDNPFDQDIAADALKALKRIETGVESARVSVKAPVLQLGRQIDALAADFTNPVLVECKRITALLSAYQTKVRMEAMAAERQRQVELARIEADRRAAEAAAQKRAAEILAAVAEAKRQADAALRASTDAEAEKAAQASAAAAAQAEAQQQQHAIHAQAAQREREAQMKALTVAKPAPQADGMTVRQVWKFEVTDIHALYRARPDLVSLEPRTREINSAMSKGFRECPGLRIWSETVAGVRV